MRRNMNVKLVFLGLTLTLGLLALALVAALPGGASIAQTVPQTWYVNGSCTVCGAGTSDSPFPTINEALVAAGDGDTILIAEGTYTEHLVIDFPVTVMGGYAATSPTWTRDISRHETIVMSDDPTVPGDWNGDWLGSPTVVKDGSTYRMWYSAGSEIDGESIGYAESPDGVNWFEPLSGPLLEAGPLDAWDGFGVANPAVLVTGGGFQMWYVGLDAFGNRAIGYASSPDGLAWQEFDGNPVLRPDAADFISFGFPTVVQDGPNDYKMWYSGGSNIWLATSSDGLNWTKHLATPVLAPGPPGAWDDAAVVAPQVMTGSDGYKMWYVGKGTLSSEQRIGYAWSDDGVYWTKSPSNPVLTGRLDTWEQGEVAYSAVIKQGPTYYQMWYRGGLSGGHAFGQATSSNGITWTKYGGNPLLSPGRPTQWGSSVVTLRGSSNGVALDGLTITGGFTRFGGGIYLDKMSATIRNCKVTGNVACKLGGGIYLLGASQAVHDHTMTGNVSRTLALGVNSGASAPLIENTVVTNNMAGGGGGIFVIYASPTISASLITDNIVREAGGGLYIWSSPHSKLISTTVANNTAVRQGGIELISGSALHVYDSRIGGNTAAQRAGIRVYESTLAMTNTFVIDNRAVGGGPGAMHFWRSSGRLVNVTIVGNSASAEPGGITFSTDRSDDRLVILNSILAFNGTDDLSCSGGTCSVTYSDVQEGFPGSGNISADPRFVNRAEGDYHLMGNSPAIDVGTSDGAPTTDFEGDPRPLDAVDMGADEFTGEPFQDVFLPLILRDS